MTNLIKEATQMLKVIESENLLTSVSSGDDNSVEFKKRGRGKVPKRPKGGGEPKEAKAVQLKVDLERAVNRREYREVARNFYPLARMINW